MVKKTMVEEKVDIEIQRLVPNLRKGLNKFLNFGIRGDYSLVMLEADDPDSANTQWTLIISAKWIDEKLDEKGHLYVVRRIMSLLEKTLRPSEYNLIHKVYLVETNNPFIKAINSSLKVRDSILPINNYNINGFQIEKAYVLQSRKIR